MVNEMAPHPIEIRLRRLGNGRFKRRAQLLDHRGARQTKARVRAGEAIPPSGCRRRRIEGRHGEQTQVHANGRKERNQVAAGDRLAGLRIRGRPSSREDVSNRA